MGILGFYGFLNVKHKSLLKLYKLDNSKLIIDGSSISHHLLIHAIKDARADFENRYQIYFDYVMKFFQKFIDHKVDIFVFINGVWKDQQLDSQIKLICEKMKDPSKDEMPIDYLFYKIFKHDIFVDVLKKLNINFVICPFLAADVIATVAKILHYPVLTANSDLFLFGIDCIFFRNLQFKDNHGSSKFFMCKIIQPHEFIKMYPGLEIFCLPLLSVLLDIHHFPEDNVYEIFWPDSSSLEKSKELSHQFTKIEKALKWISLHTLDSAVKTILDKIYKEKPSKSSVTNIERIINNFTAMSTYMLHDFKNLKSFTINQPIISTMKEKFLNYQLNNESDVCSNASVERFDTVSNILLKVPNWLLFEIKKGKINHSIIDLLQYEAYTVWPHSENLNQCSIYEMSIPLIIFIYRLLLPYINENETSPLKLFIRKDRTIECREVLVEKYPLRLEEIRVDMKIKLEIMNNILLGVKKDDVLHDLPQDWNLYFATVVFWMQQIMEPKKDEHHLYTLILAMFFIIAKGQIEKSKDQLFDAGFVEEAQKLSSEENVPKEKSLLISAIIEMTSEDLMKAADRILPMFETKQYLTEITIDTYHIFMQFQCCLEHTKMINSLLGFPYNDAVINTVIHVPLIKNLFNEISHETVNPKEYIESKLKDVPSILKVFQLLEKKFIHYVNQF